MERIRSEFDDGTEHQDIYIEPLRAIHRPHHTRRRHIDKVLCERRQIRGIFTRVAAIGQIFLDMLEMPGQCGGKLHVLDIQEKNMGTYLEKIKASMGTAPEKIHTVKARVYP